MNTHTNPKYRLAVLKDCKGDLSKSWHIEFYVYNELTDELVRKRQRIPPSLKTVKSRKDYAKQEIAKMYDFRLIRPRTQRTMSVILQNMKVN